MARRYTAPTLPPLYGVEKAPSFELTYLCAGRSFIATVRARNVQAAAEEAQIELAVQCHDFDPAQARLVRAVQTH